MEVKPCTCSVCKGKIRNAHTANAFEKWWADEGSRMQPIGNEDMEEHAHRVCKIAWMNGAYINE